MQAADAAEAAAAVQVPEGADMLDDTAADSDLEVEFRSQADTEGGAEEAGNEKADSGDASQSGDGALQPEDEAERQEAIQAQQTLACNFQDALKYLRLMKDSEKKKKKAPAPQSSST